MATIINIGVSFNCIFEESQIQLVSEFKDKFKKDVKINNMFKMRNGTFIQRADPYNAKEISVVIGNGSLENEWLEEIKNIRKVENISGYMFVDTLSLFLENDNLNNFYEFCLRAEDEADVAPPPSRKRKRGKVVLSIEEIRRIGRRLATIKGYLEAMEIFEQVNPNPDPDPDPDEPTFPGPHPKKKGSLGCNAFHKTIIMIIRLFMSQGRADMKYIQNARIKVIQNLLMMEYNGDQSIIRDIYNFPFLTKKNVESLVHNESKRLKTKYTGKSEEVAIILNLVDSFALIKKAKNPYVQTNTILNTFRDLGFKKVSIKFDLHTKKFIIDIKDFAANVFHQDHEGLKRVYSDMMMFLCNKINKLENLTKDFPRVER
jgi:hypothetical protein